MVEIEQLKELQDGKTYYIRLSDGSSREEMVNLVRNIEDLKLECTIIIGSGEFDIEEFEPKAL